MTIRITSWPNVELVCYIHIYCMYSFIDLSDWVTSTPKIDSYDFHRGYKGCVLVGGGDPSIACKGDRDALLISDKKS